MSDTRYDALKVVVTHSDGTATEFLPTTPRVRIGRMMSNDLQLASANSLSGVQCAVCFEPDGVRVEPIGPNPMSVDGEMISGPTLLQPDSVIQIGRVYLRVRPR